MKTLLTLFLLFPLFALAGDGVGDSSGGSNISWNKIINDYRRYVPEFPKVKFERGKSLALHKTCYVPETDEFRTKEEVQTTDGVDFLFQDRSYEQEVCGGRRECEWYTEIRKYPLEKDITVRAPARGDRSFGKVLFKKKYKVKVCD